MSTPGDFVYVEDELCELRAQRDDLLEALSELLDLVEDARAGQYSFDSFSLQPADAAIARARGGK